MSHFPKRAKRKNFPPSSHTIPLPRSIIYSGLAAWNGRTVYPHNLIWASALGTLARNLYLPLAITLFDHPAGWLCTCEDWRHSDRCKENAPPLS